jgi:hypothetical protein
MYEEARTPEYANVATARNRTSELRIDHLPQNGRSETNGIMGVVGH